MPQAITFPAYPSIQAFEEPPEGEEDAPYIGEIVKTYLRKFATKDEADRTYGLYDRKGNFYIGNKLAIIVDNDLVVGKDEYEGTHGLWELIVSKNQDKTKYTPEEYDNYARLVVKTNTLRRNNDPNSSYAKSSGGKKWLGLLSQIWKNRGEYEGSGVVVIPSDPNTLLERLDLLLANQKAGHTGVRNELVSICDELKRQGVLDSNTYKKFISNIKK